MNILSKDGALLKENHGWGVNVADKYNINHEDITSIGLPSQFRFKAFNFFSVQFGDDLLVHLPVAQFTPACVLSVHVYPRDASNKDSMMVSKHEKQESSMLGKCPQIDLHSTSPFAEFSDDKLKFSINKDSKTGIIKVKVDANDLDFHADLTFETKNIDEQFASIPLTEDRTRFFVSSKSFGLRATGTYSYKGK